MSLVLCVSPRNIYSPQSLKTSAKGSMKLEEVNGAYLSRPLVVLEYLEKGSKSCSNPTGQLFRNCFPLVKARIYHGLECEIKCEAAKRRLLYWWWIQTLLPGLAFSPLGKNLSPVVWRVLWWKSYRVHFQPFSNTAFPGMYKTRWTVVRFEKSYSPGWAGTLNPSCCTHREESGLKA